MNDGKAALLTIGGFLLGILGTVFTDNKWFIAVGLGLAFTGIGIGVLSNNNFRLHHRRNVNP